MRDETDTKKQLPMYEPKKAVHGELFRKSGGIRTVKSSNIKAFPNLPPKVRFSSVVSSDLGPKQRRKLP